MIRAMPERKRFFSVDLFPKYMRDRVDSIAPGLNLMPVWMTSDLSKVTTKPVSVSRNAVGKYTSDISNILHLFAGIMENLGSGVEESNCSLPCEIFSTETKLTASSSSQNSTGFVINFQQNVEVKSDKLILSQKVMLFIVLVSKHACR